MSTYKTEQTPLGKFLSSWGPAIIGVIVVLGIGYVVKAKTSFLNPPVATVAKVPEKITLPAVIQAPQSVSVVNVNSGSAPQAPVLNGAKPVTKVLVLRWNAVNSALFANGGKMTTAGSLLSQYPFAFDISTTDDYSVMKTNLIQCDQQAIQGVATPDTACVAVIMGGASADFLSLQDKSLIDAGVKLKNIGSIGLSAGEDLVLGPESILENPQNAKGMTILCVPRDDDCGLAIIWAGQNNIPVNTDESGYNPQTLNIRGASTYIEATAKFVAGDCKTLPIIVDERLSQETKESCAQMLGTWTPQDKVAVVKVPGLAVITSSKEQKYQIPAAVMVAGNWDAKHPEIMDAFLKESFVSADTMNTNASDLQHACDIAATVFSEGMPQDWCMWFKGFDVTDTTEHTVRLGGSAVINLNENLHMYGLNKGGENLFGIFYNYFKEFNAEHYSELYPFGLISLNKAFDASHLLRLRSKGVASKPIEQPAFAPGKVEHVAADRNFNIHFKVGSNVLQKDIATMQSLETIYKLTVGNVYKIELDGHSDSTGNEVTNISLSGRRAEAVKQWLMQKSPANYPDSRFNVEGYGSSHPIADNATDAGRGKNRRTEVKLGT